MAPKASKSGQMVKKRHPASYSQNKACVARLSVKTDCLPF